MNKAFLLPMATLERQDNVLHPDFFFFPGTHLDWKAFGVLDLPPLSTPMIRAVKVSNCWPVFFTVTKNIGRRPCESRYQTVS